MEKFPKIGLTNYVDLTVVEYMHFRLQYHYLMVFSDQKKTCMSIKLEYYAV